MNLVMIDNIAQLDQLIVDMTDFSLVKEDEKYYPQRNSKRLFCPYNGELLCSSLCPFFKVETGYFNDYGQLAIQCFASGKTSTIMVMSLKKKETNKEVTK